MARFEQVPVTLRAKIHELYHSGNYCFATREMGRTPSLYFSVGGVEEMQDARLDGRLRTQHRAGPLIEISTRRKQHWFFNTMTEVWRAFDRLRQRGTLDGFNHDAHNYSTLPEQGDYHFELEYNPRSGQIISLHPSGGRVDLTPIHHTRQVTEVLEHMLHYRCRIELNGTPAFYTNGPTFVPTLMPGEVPGYLAAVRAHQRR